MLSHIQHFMTPWTVAHQTCLSMGFSRQEYWSGFTIATPGDLLDPGTEIVSPAWQVHFFFFFLLLSHLGSPRPTVLGGKDKQHSLHGVRTQA